jgi:hypothetical protein
MIHSADDHEFILYYTRLRPSIWQEICCCMCTRTDATWDIQMSATEGHFVLKS